jgi:hypothetical protein
MESHQSVAGMCSWMMIRVGRLFGFFLPPAPFIVMDKEIGLVAVAFGGAPPARAALAEGLVV